MTTNDAERARKVERIKKLLALAQNNGNEHEAANALQKAQQLMEAEGVTDTEIAAQDATELFTETGASVRVPAWEDSLAQGIQRVFGIDAIHHGGTGKWSFVGVAPLPELAIYAFDVLRRQCLQARKDYIATTLNRVRVRANKTKRADLFSEGWVETAVSKAHSFRRPSEHTKAIAAYKKVRYGELAKLDAFDRNDGRTLRDFEVRDRERGRSAGDAAELRVGVGLERSRAGLLTDAGQ